MKENVVRHLRDAIGLGPDDIPAVYGEFLKTLGKSLDDLRRASDPIDFLGVRAATHTLMGFSHNVGATDLGDAAKALNAAAHDANAEACLVGIREIEAICDTYRDDKVPMP